MTYQMLAMLSPWLTVAHQLPHPATHLRIVLWTGLPAPGFAPSIGMEAENPLGGRLPGGTGPLVWKRRVAGMSPHNDCCSLMTTGTPFLFYLASLSVSALGVILGGTVLAFYGLDLSHFWLGNWHHRCLCALCRRRPSCSLLRCSWSSLAGFVVLHSMFQGAPWVPGFPGNLGKFFVFIFCAAVYGVALLPPSVISWLLRLRHA